MPNPVALAGTGDQTLAQYSGKPSLLPVWLINILQLSVIILALYLFP